MNVGEDGDQDDRLRPGHLRGAHGGEARVAAGRGRPDRGGRGAAKWRGTPPHPPPSPVAIEGSAEGRRRLAQSPGEALPDTGPAGGAGPAEALSCAPPPPPPPPPRVLPGGPGAALPRLTAGRRALGGTGSVPAPLCLSVHVQQIQALLAPPKSEDGEKKSRRPEKEPRRSGRATNHDSCDSCKEGGDLLCCDHCPAAFHLQCW